MRCPSCGSELIRVVDSRPAGSNTIRRRRECESCGHRFTTYERAASPPHERQQERSHAAA